MTRRIDDANGQFAAGVTFAGRLAHEGRAMLWTVQCAGAQLSPDVVAPGENTAAGVHRRAVHVADKTVVMLERRPWPPGFLTLTGASCDRR